MTVEGYIRELSSRKMVPGGGSVSALGAALGAGLNLMVINYTFDPSRDSESAREMILLKEKQARIMESMTSLIDEDCEVFASLMLALKEETSALEKYKAAAEVPIKVCRGVRESMAIAVQIAGAAKKGIASDVVCAAHMLRGAFYSARVNVNINLEHIQDELFAQEIKDELLAMSDDMETMLKKIEEIQI
jgi:methenyltetrahydrofolate cyclohydrolase